MIIALYIVQQTFLHLEETLHKHLLQQVPNESSAKSRIQ